MPATKQSEWFLYLLECRTRSGHISLYTGITTNIMRRYEAHQAGVGARYTRANVPQRVLASRPYANRSLASKAEAALKKRPRAMKLAFFDLPVECF